jgi:multimeric flavodoxin WrbA
LIILGISASQRKWGNTDILVRHVLKGAVCEKVEIRFLRLTDYDIRQCRGCLSCLLKDRDCIVDDQFSDLLEALRMADGVVLGSPVYSLFAAGSIQMLVPRLFRQVYTGELEGKLGIALAVGGRPGWEGWALPQVSAFFLSLGMPLVDQFMGYGQGPGEVLFESEACKRALNSGKAMATGEPVYRGKSGTCPVCHFDLVATRQGGRPWCTLCDLPGRWVECREEKQFEPLSGARPRWGYKEMREHFEKMILPSGQRFLSRKEEIRQKLETFRKGNNHG